MLPVLEIEDNVPMFLKNYAIHRDNLLSLAWVQGSLWQGCEFCECKIPPGRNFQIPQQIQSGTERHYQQPLALPLLHLLQWILQELDSKQNKTKITNGRKINYNYLLTNYTYFRILSVKQINVLLDTKFVPLNRKTLDWKMQVNVGWQSQLSSVM